MKIEEVQQIVLSHNPHPYYIEKYMGQESFYWLGIPKFLEEFGNKFSMTILDIGGAYGTLATYARMLYPSAEITLSDISKDWISQDLLDAERIKFLLNDIEKEPIEGSYDIIILTEVLEHFNFNPVPTLQKIISMIKYDGSLLLSTPDSDSTWGKLKHYQNWKDMPTEGERIISEKEHVYQFNLTELSEIVKEAGGRIKQVNITDAPWGRHISLEIKK